MFFLKERTKEFWMNIDRPTKKCTIHSTGCTNVDKKAETKL